MESQRTILLIGAAGVGKTALVTRYAEDKFVATYEPTLESNFIVSTEYEGRKTSLRIREIGAGGFSARVTAGVDAYLIVFSLIDPTSFTVAANLHASLSSFVGDAAVVPRVLVGTFLDSMDDFQDQWNTARQQAEALRCPIIKVSSKTGEGVALVFQTVMAEIDRMERRFQPAATPKAVSAPDISAADVAQPSTCDVLLSALTCGLWRPSNNDDRPELAPAASPLSTDSDYHMLRSPVEPSPTARLTSPGGLTIDGTFRDMALFGDRESDAALLAREVQIAPMEHPLAGFASSQALQKLTKSAGFADTFLPNVASSSQVSGLGSAAHF